jgi:alpha-tubulin suppressor-like RCC1 family protein
LLNMLRTTRRRLLPALAAAGVTAAVIAPVTVSAAPAAATTTPQVATWGSDVVGSLGDRSALGHSTPGPVSALPAGTRQVVLGEGGGFDIAVNADGTVSAWGQGSLGNGSTSSPTPVSVPGLTGITQVAIGLNHVLALANDGTVWAWGINNYGQVGDGTLTERLVPEQVQGLTGITQVAAGDLSSFALRSDGTVWAWGNNQSGELGNGTTTDSPVPGQVPGLTGITQITAGGFSALAVRSDGSLAAWGGNSLGALGDGTRTDRHSPVPVPSLSDVRQLSTSGNATLAITGSNGQVWAWGGNAGGQLGDGTTTTRPIPEQIGVTGATHVSAGFVNGAAVLSNGTLETWGENGFGQLGFLQADNPQLLPRTVPGLAGVTQAQLTNGEGVAIAASVSVSHTTVPGVFGDTPAQAVAAVQAAGLLAMGFTSTSNCSPANHGLILAANPAAGTVQQTGSWIQFQKCDSSMTLVPDVAGSTPAEAATALQAVGLTVGSTGLGTSCDVPVGTIIRTIPPAGSTVANGATIGLIKSRSLSPGC